MFEKFGRDFRPSLKVSSRGFLGSVLHDYRMSQKKFTRLVIYGIKSM